MALLILTALVALLVFAALHDVATMTIPNWVSVALIVGFFPAALFAGFSLEQMGIHLAVAAAMLVVTIVLFMLNVFGGGDAKMLAAVSIWSGPAGLSPMLMGVAIVGGLLAATVLVGRKFVPAANAPWFVQKPLTDGEGVPYAVAISAGVLWAAPASPLLGKILAIAQGLH